MVKIARYVTVRGIVAGIAVLAAVCGTGILAGCPAQSGKIASTPPATHTAAFGGVINGGRQPIVGAFVQVYEANPTAGSPATLIGIATTDANGHFTIAGFSPEHASGAVIYVVADGGDAYGSGSSNAAIKLATVAGIYCTSPGCGFPATVNVNELTTVAMAYSLSGFTDLSGGSVNISGGGSGLTNAVKTFTNLVDVTTGQATVPGASGCVGTGEPANCDALRRLNTLANVAADCINSTGPTSTKCSYLFTATQPAAGSKPTNTLAALFNIATVPEIRNKGAAIQGLYLPSTVYAPSLSTAPNAWLLGLNFTDAGLNQPNGIAVDAAGKVWVANTGNDNVMLFDPAAQSFTKTVNVGSRPIDLAVSPTGSEVGDIYVSNSADTTVSIIDPTTATAIASVNVGGHPGALAVSPTGPTAGNLYVLNISPVSSNASVIDPATNTVIANAAVGIYPYGIAVLPTGPVGGNFYVTDANANKFYVVDLDTNTVVESVNVGNSPQGIAVAASGPNAGDVYVVNNADNSISVFDPTTNMVSTAHGGGLDFATSIAIDGVGQVWTSSSGNSTVNEFDANGTPLSPPSGYGAGGINQPQQHSIAVDASGNVWVSNFGNNSLTELIGAAAPTPTPLGS